MASPCEVLIDGGGETQARSVLDAVAGEAWRVEDKFSRYRHDNIVHAINASRGTPVDVDPETADLLDFCARLHVLSAGRFDITSGVLRRAWKFDGGTRVPSGKDTETLLSLVGWNKASWTRPSLTLRDGMEIDFGGVGKEYAVDRAAVQARRLCEASCLVNFGGDLAISRPRRSATAWRVGIETAHECTAGRTIDIWQGALATSGDTYRYVARDGRRYTHILDPLTGRPVENAPRSVTVAAESCTQAGMLTTLALLHGAGAEEFLQSADVQYWIQR
jgi:FAD:protein FMN transferase